MKKIFVLFVFIITSVASAPLARAEEHPQITVGLKVWNATWKQTSPDFPVIKTDALLVGPTIGLRRDNFFAGLTYMSGTFDFPDEDFVFNEPKPCVSICRSGSFLFESEADRKDLDLVVGTYVEPNWGVFVGYKKSDLTVKATLIDNTGTNPSITDEFDIEYSGPVIGVIFNAPLEIEPWVIFGNLTYLLLEVESDGEKEDAPGFSGELAAAYPLENFPVSLTIGYKAQRFEEDSFEDDVQGLTFGANYTFR